MSAKPSFFAELQRRHVYKVGAMYCVGGWLLVQIVTQVFPVFHVSEVAQQYMVLAVVAGFPVALVLAWVFDITPQGIVRTGDAPAAGEPVAAIQQRRSTERKLNYLLGALLLAALGYFIFERAAPRDKAVAVPNTGDVEKSIAVLPFDNLSDDKANAYFAEGIQDEILTRLAGIGSLKVISRTSTEKYKSRPDNLRTVAEELGAGAILEGSVQKAGDSARINVQLIDARADRHLWAQTYDRKLQDVFAVESEVSQSIADALKAQLSPSESGALAAAPTQNGAAYDWFLKAEHAANQARNGELEADYRSAEADYRQALALDPGFALARARLALCALNRHWFVWRLPPAELTEVKADIDLALSQAPNLAEAHVALGYYHYWVNRDYGDGTAELSRALELAPSNLDALIGLASIHRRRGDWDQALQGFRKATEIAPRDSIVVEEYGETYTMMRRYSEAEAALRRALALEPDQAEAINYLILLRLFADGDVAGAHTVVDGLPPERRARYNYFGGDVLTLTGPWVAPDLVERRFNRALQAWDAAPQGTRKQQVERLAARAAILVMAGRRQENQADCTLLKGFLQEDAAADPAEPAILTDLSWAELCLGHDDAAFEAARRASALLPLSKDAYFGAYYLGGQAQIAAWTGHADEALRLIQQLLSIPAGDYVSSGRLRLDPVWDPLRKDPRFQKLIAGQTENKSTP